MNHAAFDFDLRSATQSVVDEVVGLLAGGVFTIALFLGMAHVENIGEQHPVAEIEDLRTYSVPFEPPPPLPSVAQPTEQADASPLLSGIELGATDSPVSIGVVPPDIELMFPANATAPKARVQFNALHTDLKPRMDMEIDVAHIYQESEVDRKPRAVVRTVPPIPGDVSGNAPTLRVLLLMVLDTRGKVESVRVLESSGNARFDEIVARTVKDEWLFTPATRRGKKVRVMAQQAFRVNFTGGSSPFNVE